MSIFKPQLGGVPNTRTSTSHAIAIKVQGKAIGMIQTWAPAQARVMTPNYEINGVTNGDIAEYIPGPISGNVIQVMRYDLYKSRMEQAWGFSDEYGERLSNQDNPFDIQEVWMAPGVKKVSNTDPFDFSAVGSDIKDAFNFDEFGADSAVGIHVNLYRSCWFSSLGRNLAVQGDRLVNVSATLVYTRKMTMTL